jgi:hypothetical protein
MNHPIKKPNSNHGFGFKWTRDGVEATAYGIMGILGVLAFFGLLTYGLRYGWSG